MHTLWIRIINRWRFDAALFWRLLRFGVPSGLHLIADAGGFTLFLLFIGRLGVIPLAATNIAFNINTMRVIEEPIPGAPVWLPESPDRQI